VQELAASVVDLGTGATEAGAAEAGTERKLPWWVESGASVVSGIADLTDHDGIGALASMIGGGAKAGSGNFGGGLADAGNGVLGAYEWAASKFPGASPNGKGMAVASGLWELACNGMQAAANYDKAEADTWDEAKDFYSPAGDAYFGGAKALFGGIFGKPGEYGVAGTKLALDGAGMLAGMIGGEDAKFGAGDAVGYGMYSDYQSARDGSTGGEAAMSAAHATATLLSGGIASLPGSRALFEGAIDLVKGE
jgi:hypothetical protein